VKNILKTSRLNFNFSGESVFLGVISVGLVLTLSAFSHTYTPYGVYLNALLSFCVAALFLIRRGSLKVNLKITIAIFLMSICYFALHRGYAFFAFAIAFIAFSIFESKSIQVYSPLKKTVECLLALGLLSHVLFLNDLTVPIDFNFGDRPMYLHWFAISDYPLRSENPSTWRFYGFLNEPGSLAAFILLFLVKEGFRIRGNVLFWISGLFTFSTSFMGIVLFYQALSLVTERKIKLEFYFLIFFSVAVAYYFFGTLVTDYLLVKFFYVFHEDLDYDSRIDSSIVLLYSKSPLFAVFYVAAILLLPVRFWLLFLVLMFYRVHFFINYVPFLLVLLSGKSTRNGGPLLRFNSRT
jgi:hypothetical protein